MDTLAIDYDLSLVKIQPAHNIQMLLQTHPAVTEATANVDGEPGNRATKMIHLRVLAAHRNL